MIDTALIRAKVLEQAVFGELSSEFSSGEDSLIELRRVTGRIINENDSEVPYELKDGWHWIAISELGADDKHSFADGPFGSNLKKEHYTEKVEVRIIQLSNIGELGWKNENVKYTTFEHLETIQRSEVKAGNIVIAKMMPAGRAIVVPDVNEKYVLSSDCVKFVPCEFLSTKYLCYAINSSMFRKQVLQDVHGIGRERTSLSKLKTYLLPIPCKAEQDYIVDKIDKAYEQLAILDILQSQYSSDLEVLKSKIIDAGIQGKLTEQLPEDGTAEELLEQIAEEKKLLIKEKKIKATKALPEITEDEIPFEIPNNWIWVRLDNIARKVFAGGDKPEDFQNEKDAVHPYPVVANGVKDDGILGYSAKYTAESDTVTVAGRGTIGFSVYRDYKYCPIVRLIVVEPSAGINPRYLKYVFQGMPAGSVGSSIPQLTVPMLKPKLIPLPPTNEQNRIVARIDEVLEQIEMI